MLKGQSITENDVFPTYLSRPSSSILKKNNFLVLQKCSKPVMKIGFREQLGLSTFKMPSQYCVNNRLSPFQSLALHRIIAVFPSVSGSFRQFLAITGSFRQFPRVPKLVFALPNLPRNIETSDNPFGKTLDLPESLR